MSKPESLDAFADAIAEDLAQFKSGERTQAIEHLLFGRHVKEGSPMREHARDGVERVFEAAATYGIDMHCRAIDPETGQETVSMVRKGVRYATLKAEKGVPLVGTDTLPSLSNDFGIQTLPQLWAYLGEYETESWPGFVIRNEALGPTFLSWKADFDRHSALFWELMTAQEEAICAGEHRTADRLNRERNRAIDDRNHVSAKLAKFAAVGAGVMN